MYYFKRDRKSPCSEVTYKTLHGLLKGLDVSHKLDDTICEDWKQWLPDNLQYMINDHSDEMKKNLRLLMKTVGKFKGQVHGAAADDEDEHSYYKKRVNSCLKALERARLCRLLFAGEAEFDLLKWGLKPKEQEQNGPRKVVHTTTVIKQLQEIGTEIESILKSYEQQTSDKIINDFLTYQSLLQYMYLKMFSIILEPWNHQSIVTEEEWLEQVSRRNKESPGSATDPELSLKGIDSNSWEKMFKKALFNAVCDVEAKEVL